MPNLSTTIRGRSLVAVVANLLGGRFKAGIGGRRTAAYHLPLDALRSSDYERSDATASGASTRAEVKDALCCGPPIVKSCAEGTPALVVRSSRVTRNAGVPLESRSRSTVKVRVE